MELDRLLDFGVLYSPFVETDLCGVSINLHPKEHHHFFKFSPNPPRCPPLNGKEHERDSPLQAGGAPIPGGGWSQAGLWDSRQE